MLHELSMAIDLISVIAASVVGMIIGMSWYSTMLFGKEWMKLSGITPAKAKQSKKKGMGKSIGLGFIAGIVMAYVIAYFIDVLAITTYYEAAAVAAMAWLGFIATSMLNSVLWEGKPTKLYLINISHQLVSTVAMSAVIVYMA
jgi:hypothetical protein